MIRILACLAGTADLAIVLRDRGMFAEAEQLEQRVRGLR